MKLSKFKFKLPEELIALHPADNRDESRLMVVDRKNKTIEHKFVITSYSIHYTKLYDCPLPIILLNWRGRS